MKPLYDSPIHDFKPFEESQGTGRPISPEDHRHFYAEMDRQDQYNRQFAPRKPAGKNRLSRPRPSRPSTDPVVHPQQPLPPTPYDERPAKLTRASTDSPREKGKQREEPVMDGELRAPEVAISVSTTSIIPEVGPTVWNGKLIPVFNYKSTYPIHNPIGPRWYRNHHLIAPQAQGGPNSATFSPSFPPIPSSDRTDDGGMPGPSRTPSGSPLPTPNSSQSGIEDGGPALRSRKVSQSAHDGVDLLDATDPWGTNWHHQSPYDVGMNPSQVNVANDARSRARAISLTNGRKKPSAPSPLSQSTSALVPAPYTTPRKLSKKRKQGIRGLFGGSVDRVDSPIHRVESAPTSPDQNGIAFPYRSDNTLVKPGTYRRTSTFPSNPSPPGGKHEKRGSVLGRLSRKISILRRGLSGHESYRDSADWDNPKPAEAYRKSTASPQELIGTSSSPPKQLIESRATLPDTTRRVPLPHIEIPGPISLAPTNNTLDADDRSSSSISIETPFSIGPLMIANPDVTSSPPVSPVRPIGNVPFERDSGVSPALEYMQATSTLFPEPHADVTNRLSRASHASRRSIHHSRTETLSPPEPPALKPPSPQPSESRPKSRHVERSEWDEPPPPQTPAPPPVPKDLVQIEIIPTPIIATDSISADDNYPVSRMSMYVNPPTPQLAHLPAPPQLAEIPTSPPPKSSSPKSPSPPGSPVLANGKASHSSSRHKHSSRSKPTAAEAVAEPKTSTSRKDKAKPATTETFKLIRSSSDHAQVQNDTIVVGEQQWTIIPASERKKLREREKTRSKDDEPPRRKESRRQDSSQSDRSKEERYSRVPRVGEHRSGAADGPSKSGHHHSDRDRGSDSRRDRDRERERDRERDRNRDRDRERERDRDRGERNKERERERERERDKAREDKERERERDRDREHRRDRDRERKSERDREHHRNPPTYEHSSRKDKTSSQQLAPSPKPERKSSNRRPVSDVPPTADMSTLTAREAWEMDRLWRGKSAVYGPEVVGVVASDVSSPYEIHAATGVVGSPVAVPNIYGSSHTSYAVQRPFHGQATAYVQYSPTAVRQNYLYQSPTVPSMQSPPMPSYGYAPIYPSYHETVSFPTIPSEESSPTRRPLSNPLPDPPRQSTYQPIPVPIPNNRASHASMEDPATPEYWSQYAGITTH